jgi:hypothetical protein
LYQFGYLTIKDVEDDMYRLAIPNNEVSKAIYEVVLPALTKERSIEYRALFIGLNLAHKSNIIE